MTIKVNLFHLFILVAFIQLAIPATMIYSHEAALSKGRPFKFRTNPVDPLDPFRGRYVNLNIAANNAPADEKMRLKQGMWVYVSVTRDDEGYARLDKVSMSKPDHSNYLRLQVRHSYAGRVHFNLPFNRYYAEETLAPEIERSYLRARRQSRETTYVSIRVYNGTGVIEELYLSNLPVMEYLKREARNNAS